MAFSIRLTEQEKKLADSYARLHSISLGEAFKQALFEKIEEEYAELTAKVNEYNKLLSDEGELMEQIKKEIGAWRGADERE